MNGIAVPLSDPLGCLDIFAAIAGKVTVTPYADTAFLQIKNCIKKQLSQKMNTACWKIVNKFVKGLVNIIQFTQHI